MTSFERLVSDFKSLGIKEGDVLLVHSSLSSMGNVEGGADTVIDALLEVLGKEGTLLFPAFSFSPCYKTSYFSYKDTPSCVGKISEKIDMFLSFYYPMNRKLKRWTFLLF